MIKQIMGGINQIFIVISCLLFSWLQSSAQCQYTLTLLDSYGDGWNGNSMYVQTSGYSPSNLTFNSGSFLAILTYSLNSLFNIFLSDQSTGTFLINAKASICFE